MAENWDKPIGEPAPALGPEWSIPIGEPKPVKPAVKQEYGPLAGAKMFGHALATGVQGVLGLPSDLASAAFAPDPAAAPWQKATQNALTSFPGSQAIGEATGLGLAQHPEFTPQNAGERFAVAGVEALPNAALMTATGGMSVLPALATAEGGAMSAEGARELFPGNKWAPVIAGVLGSLGAGWASSSVTGWLAGREATKRLAEAKAALEEAKQARVAGGQQAESSADALRNASKAELTETENLARMSEEVAGSQAHQAVQKTAQALGPAKTLEEAGKTLQAQAREWLSTVMPKKMAAVAKPLDEAIPPGTVAPINNFSGAYSKIDKKALINKLDLPDTLLGRVKESLGLGPGSVEELVGEAIPPAPLTWAETRQLRTAIGDALARPKIVSDIGEQNVKQLYAAVTQDLERTAKEAGAGDLFKAFNEESTRLHQIQAGPMGRLISTGNAAKELITPEAAAKAVVAASKNGGTELAILRGEIPGAVDDLAAAQLRTGGFAKLSPEARAILAREHAPFLEASEEGKALAAENAKRVVEEAKAAHDATLAAAKTARIKNKHALTNALTDASRAKDQAAAAVPPPSNPATDLANTIRNVSAVAGGYAGGPWALNQLGVHVTPEAGALFGAAALGAPLALQAGKTLLTNPGTAMIPVTGALAGQNALAPPAPRR